MKKIIYPLLTALLSAAYSLPAQTLLLPLLQDSSHYFYYDPATGLEQFKVYSYHHYNADNLEDTAWYHNYFGSIPSFFRYNYEYNGAKLITKSTSLRSLTAPVGPWENWLKDDYQYDIQGRNTYFLGQLGDPDGGWYNYYQQYAWFDDAAPADSSVYELWNDSALAWDNYNSKFNYYFPDGAIRQALSRDWDMQDGSWLDRSKDDYTYYPDGKMFTYRHIAYNQGQISTIQRDSFLYRPDGRVDTTFTSIFVAGSGTENQFVIKSEYDAGGHLIQKTSLKRTGNDSWTPSSRETFAPGDGYFSNDFTLENLATFNTNTQTFRVIWEIVRQYSDIGNGQVLFREERKQLDNQGILSTQYIDTLWYRQATVNTKAPVAPFGADCQFANPFQPGGSITCQAPDQQSSMLIRVTNMSGQIVAQARVMPGEAWRPGANWPAGPYFLTAWQNGRFLGQRKIHVTANF